MANQDIKVGDVGTVYFLPTFDDDLAPANFDPTAATVKQIVFKMPGTSVLITRTAVAAQETIDGVATWGLQYTVTAADVAAYVDATTGGFHQAAGPVKIEGYVEFSSSQKWASSRVTVDQQERDLKISRRLA